MSSSPSALSRPGIVRRLRAAGCVFAEEEADLLLGEIGTAAWLAVAVSQRAAGMSLEHVLGWAHFCGLRIAVSRGVFVPRRRTQLLVEQAIAVTPSSARVVDLCCGTGAVGMAVASATDPAALYAVDIDPLTTTAHAATSVPAGTCSPGLRAVAARPSRHGGHRGGQRPLRADRRNRVPVG